MVTWDAPHGIPLTRGIVRGIPLDSLGLYHIENSFGDRYESCLQGEKYCIKSENTAIAVICSPSQGSTRAGSHGRMIDAFKAQISS